MYSSGEAEGAVRCMPISCLSLAVSNFKTTQPLYLGQTSDHHDHMTTSPRHLARQIRQDVEALTGLKTAQLFNALDVRGNGYLSLEAGHGLQQQCTTIPVEHLQLFQVLHVVIIFLVTSDLTTFRGEMASACRIWFAA